MGGSGKTVLFEEKKGFTFMELLMFMAIVGILATAMFVLLGYSQRERARLAAFKGSMKSVSTAAQVCIDQDGKILVASAGGVMCDSNSSLKFPAIRECSNAGVTLDLAVNDPVGADWEIGAVCSRSGSSGNCVALCDANGCSFSPSSTSLPDACN